MHQYETLPRAGDFSRSSLTHPFVSVEAIIDLSWNGIFGRKTEIDLRYHDFGVVDDVPAHAFSHKSVGLL